MNVSGLVPLVMLALALPLLLFGLGFALYILLWVVAVLVVVWFVEMIRHAPTGHSYWWRQVRETWMARSLGRDERVPQVRVGG